MCCAFGIFGVELSYVQMLDDRDPDLNIDHPFTNTAMLKDLSLSVATACHLTGFTHSASSL